MDTRTFAAMRGDIFAREDFLLALSRQCASSIAYVTRQMIGNRATSDLIRNEATQEFLKRANAAINTARLDDDGRGKNDPVEWVKFKALNGLRDWLRVEFGTDTRNTRKAEFEKKTVYAEDLYRAKPTRQEPAVNRFADPFDYAEGVLSTMLVHEFMRDLQPVDRSIIGLLVFGSDEWGHVRTASTYGAKRHRVAADIAHTIGMSEQFVFKRLAAIRTIARERGLGVPVAS